METQTDVIFCSELNVSPYRQIHLSQSLIIRLNLFIAKGQDFLITPECKYLKLGVIFSMNFGLYMFSILTSGEILCSFYFMPLSVFIIHVTSPSGHVTVESLSLFHFGILYSDK